MASPLYFAPTYFSPYYFAPFSLSGGAQTTGTTTPYGDSDAFGFILALLKETGAFERVLFSGSLDTQHLNSSSVPSVLVVPGGWEEFDEVDPFAILRRVDFSLLLLVRDDDSFTRFDQLARLESVIHNSLEASNLGGCLPALTRIRRGHYDLRSLHPEQMLQLDGEFTYMIDPNSSIL